MNIITAREFRANQKKYFELAEKEPVLIARTKGRPAISISVADQCDLPSEELLDSINKGVEDIKSGRVTVVKDPNNIWESVL